MEKAYKIALEIILNMCKQEESYIRAKEVQLVCETALKEREDKEI